jgi:23S rRNA (guanosine2251-2'-O)-methyltransferase
MDHRVAYGIHSVRTALLRGIVQRVYLLEGIGAKRLGRLAQEIERAGVEVVAVCAAELEQLTGTAKHQGVAAMVQGLRVLSERETTGYVAQLKNPFLLVLDGVQDPRNMGSLLRTANAAGVDLVITGRNRNVGMTPVVSKVACGAAEVQPRAEVANLARILGDLAASGVAVIGTDERAPQSLFDTDLTGPLALVLGGEGQGMRRLTQERCSSLISLPMHGIVPSLNVAVAAGICLYEGCRQRRLAPCGDLG